MNIPDLQNECTTLSIIDLLEEYKLGLETRSQGVLVLSKVLFGSNEYIINYPRKIFFSRDIIDGVELSILI